MKFKLIKELVKQILNQEIIAEDKYHLRDLINRQIKLKGLKCNLNHINVSKIDDFSNLFEQFEFNGDISKWDTSNAKSMAKMFFCSKFTGDISKWDTSKVEDMEQMFHGAIFNGDISNWDVTSVRDMNFMFASSKFNSDISNWDVSKVQLMEHMFSHSDFKQDLSNWKPYKLEYTTDMFKNCKGPIPYWLDYENSLSRSQAIKSYLLSKELGQELVVKNHKPSKKPKL